MSQPRTPRELFGFLFACIGAGYVIWLALVWVPWRGLYELLCLYALAYGPVAIIWAVGVIAAIGIGVMVALLLARKQGARHV